MYSATALDAQGDLNPEHATLKLVRPTFTDDTSVRGYRGTGCVCGIWVSILGKNKTRSNCEGCTCKFFPGDVANQACFYCDSSNRTANVFQG